MKRILYVLAATTLASATLLSAQDAEVRGKKVIDDAIAALGGQKFLTMQDRIEKGRAYSFFHDQVSGLSMAKIYTRYIYVPPDRTGIDLGLQERDAFGKNEDYYVLFRQEGAWEVTFRGPKELEKDRVQRYRDTTLNDVLYILRVRLHEPGIIFESQGSDVVENQPVDVVDITDSQNRVVRAYFHQIHQASSPAILGVAGPGNQGSRRGSHALFALSDDGWNPVAAADTPRAKW